MIDFFLFAALSLFVIINPFSSIPAFLSITPDDTTAERISAARKASVIAGVILVFFAATGHYLFKFLGLTISAVQISGGILLFLIALDMMRFASIHADRLNPIVVRILRRLMGLIFAVIAVQFVIDGISHLPFVSIL